MAKLNEAGAIELASAVFPHIETYAKKHGDTSTVVDGMWALAHVVAYLICSSGVNETKARSAFIRALDHAIAHAPPDDEVVATTKH